MLVTNTGPFFETVEYIANILNLFLIFNIIISSLSRQSYWLNLISPSILFLAHFTEAGIKFDLSLYRSRVLRNKFCIKYVHIIAM